jgi:hypothetical protein
MNTTTRVEFDAVMRGRVRHSDLIEACKMQSAHATVRDIRKGDLWRSARNARKRARQVIRAAGGVA